LDLALQVLVLVFKDFGFLQQCVTSYTY
jgi:hypothetical protein